MPIEINNLKIILTMGVLGYISKIDRYDAAWTAREKKEGVSLKELKNIATVTSVGASTRIEGSKLSDAEVEQIVWNIKEAKLEERDQQEVAGYYKALDTITENYPAMEVSENQIKNLHKIMLAFSSKDAWHRGNYKQHPNSVEETRDGVKRTIFSTAAPGFETEDAMRNLIQWYKVDVTTTPIIKIALFVYEFLSIHPFQDGNGRLSRLLTTLLLLKQGYGWIQYVSFEKEIESRKAEYYNSLMEGQRNRPGENVDGWMNFFLNALVNIQIKLDEKLKVVNDSVKLPPHQLKVLAFLDHHPNSRSGEISERLNIPLPTVKKALSDLLKQKIISRYGTGKATTYVHENSHVTQSDMQFILGNKTRTKEFLLINALESIEIKKIIFQPHFEWEKPAEWALRASKQDLQLKITCMDADAGKAEHNFHLTPYISPDHFQPVFNLQNRILVPGHMFSLLPGLGKYPIRVTMELLSDSDPVDFDIHFIYDAALSTDPSK
jgi:Fic family protein